MPRLELKQSTKFKLISLSGNQCAFPGCDQNLVDEEGHFVGDFCHINAAEQGGERYDENQSDEDRRDISNIILLCANHHRVTDDVEAYDADLLRQMKRSHESKYISKPYVPQIITLEEIGAVIDERLKERLLRNTTTDIYRESDFENDMHDIQERFQTQLNNVQIQTGGNSSAIQVASMLLQKKATQQRQRLQKRKADSDRLYELEREEINEKFEDLYQKKTAELNERGVYHSGFGKQELDLVKKQRDREIERLNIKYGKS